MNLGTETGSLINHILTTANRQEPELVVGLGGTVFYWSDRKPVTVVEVNQKKRYIAVTEDHCERINIGGQQQWVTRPQYDEHRKIYRKDKKGQWRECYLNDKNRLTYVDSGKGPKLVLGYKDKFEDESF